MVAQAPGVQATPAEPPAQVQARALPPDLTPPPQIDRVLKGAAERHGVPVNALRALAAQESGFRPDVVGGTPIDLPGQQGDRARGMFQFTPQEIAKMPGFDPNDPEQAADETARRLRARLDEGKPIDIAMMEHFGGPNPEIHGPRTRQYHKEITEKFQRLEQATNEGAPAASRREQMQAQSAIPPGVEAGPFGSINQPGGPNLPPVQQLLQSVAQDPRAFAEQFAGEGGVERIVSLLGGGDGQEQTRVISGDTPEGQAMGIRPGERARVAGKVTASGRFVPSEVKAAPFSGADVGGPLVSLINMKTGKGTSLRRDDPRVDELIRGGDHVVATDGAMMDTLEGMSQKERSTLTESTIGARTYIATVGDALTMLNETPDINTFVARGAALINDIKAEARAFGRAMGAEFDESIFDVTANRETFKDLGIDRERMQSLITSLAFQRAVAEKGGAGRITNRDIERFIVEIGGRSSDPQALAQVLQDTAQRTARGHRIRFEEMTGGEFSGDLGLDRLPRFAPAPTAPAAPATDPGQVPGVGDSGLEDILQRYGQ